MLVSWGPPGLPQGPQLASEWTSAFALGGGPSQAPVEALDPVAADGDTVEARIGGVAGRADVDRDRCRGRTGRERRSARGTADVDKLQVRVMCHVNLLLESG